MKRLATVLVLLAAAATLAVSAAAAPAAKHAKKRVAVTVAMKDPGCHWFLSGTKYTKSLTVRGIAVVRNIDEAGLVFKGAGLKKTLAVGKTLRIAKPGVYRITMVDQEPDDNTLVLRVKA